MKYLYHCDDINVEDVIDGTLYVIPPNKIVEVKNDFHAEAILSHKHFQGLVEVTIIPKEDGSGFDWTPGYKQIAADRLAASDDNRIQDWVQGQIEERVRKNYPALPPSDRLKLIIKRRGVEISNFGLHPVEIKQGQKPVASPAESVNVTELIQQRNTLEGTLKLERQERETDRQRMDKLTKQVEALLAMRANAEVASGKESDDDNKSNVDEGADGQGTSGSASGSDNVASIAGQPTGEQPQSGSDVIDRPSKGGDANSGGQGDSVSTATDPTLRPVRRPGQRR